MGYTNIREAMKWCYNKLKFCSFTKFDEHNNNFGKFWYPGSNLLNMKDTLATPIIKIDLYYHTFITEYIFE